MFYIREQKWKINIFLTKAVPVSVRKDENIHTSVLLHELVQGLDIQRWRQNIIVDCTLGLAGHASAVIAKMNPGDIFIGFDADERNLKLATERLEVTVPKYTQNPALRETPSGVKIVLLHSNFRQLKAALGLQNIEKITGIYYDLWVSSLHFDEAERGFSLRQDGPLDMRFDANSGITAYDILVSYPEEELARIFFEYGEEKASRKIAHALVVQRKKSHLKSTWELAAFLDTLSPHPKTKTRIFQALRIEVNGELQALQESLKDAIHLLETDGKIFVISFHSLEDRIVKQIFKQETKDCICSDIICRCGHTKTLEILTKKPILPSPEEQKNNTRSRSAKARLAKKISL